MFGEEAVSVRKLRPLVLVVALVFTVFGMAVSVPGAAHAYDKSWSLDSSDENWMVRDSLSNAKAESKSCALNMGARRLATRVGLRFGAVPTIAAVVGGFVINRLGTSACKSAYQHVKFAWAVHRGKGNGRKHRMRVYKDGFANWRCTWKRYVNYRAAGPMKEVFKITWPAVFGCPD